MPIVTWTKKAKKQLSRIDIRYREMIFEKAGELENFPDVQLDLKKLHDSKEKEYRVRVGTYRVLFTVIEGNPVIIQIDEVLRRTTGTY